MSFVFLIAALTHQRHFALPYRRERIIDFVRSIVDKHLFRLIILINTVEHTHGVETTDEIKDECRCQNQDEDSPTECLADVFHISVVAEHDDRKGSGVVVIDERSA